jgi:hypothetical protein
MSRDTLHSGNMPHQPIIQELQEPNTQNNTYNSGAPILSRSQKTKAQHEEQMLQALESRGKIFLNRMRTRPIPRRHQSSHSVRMPFAPPLTMTNMSFDNTQQQAQGQYELPLLQAPALQAPQQFSPQQVQQPPQGFIPGAYVGSQLGQSSFESFGSSASQQSLDTGIRTHRPPTTFGFGAHIHQPLQPAQVLVPVSHMAPQVAQSPAAPFDPSAKPFSPNMPVLTPPTHTNIGFAAPSPLDPLSGRGQTATHPQAALDPPAQQSEGASSSTSRLFQDPGFDGATMPQFTDSAPALRDQSQATPTSTPQLRAETSLPAPGDSQNSMPLAQSSHQPQIENSQPTSTSNGADHSQTSSTPATSLPGSVPDQPASTGPPTAPLPPATTTPVANTNQRTSTNGEDSKLVALTTTMAGLQAELNKAQADCIKDKDAHIKDNNAFIKDLQARLEITQKQASTEQERIDRVHSAALAHSERGRADLGHILISNNQTNAQQSQLLATSLLQSQQIGAQGAQQQLEVLTPVINQRSAPVPSNNFFDFARIASMYTDVFALGARTAAELFDQAQVHTTNNFAILRSELNRDGGQFRSITHHVDNSVNVQNTLPVDATTPALTSGAAVSYPPLMQGVNDIILSSMQRLKQIEDTEELPTVNDDLSDKEFADLIESIKGSVGECSDACNSLLSDWHVAKGAAMHNFKAAVLGYDNQDFHQWLAKLFKEATEEVIGAEQRLVATIDTLKGFCNWLSNQSDRRKSNWQLVLSDFAPSPTFINKLKSKLVMELLPAYKRAHDQIVSMSGLSPQNQEYIVDNFAQYCLFPGWKEYAPGDDLQPGQRRVLSEEPGVRRITTGLKQHQLMDRQ